MCCFFVCLLEHTPKNYSPPPVGTPPVVFVEETTRIVKELFLTARVLCVCLCVRSEAQQRFEAIEGDTCFKQIAVDIFEHNVTL